IQDRTYWGSDVHYAARLAAAAHGGQVLASCTTRALVRDYVFASVGEHGLKDFASPREVFQVVIDGVGAEAFPPLRTLSRVRTNLATPGGAFVGREQEIAELTQYCAESERLVTIVGPGGSGKTRLAVELGHRLV